MFFSSILMIVILVVALSTSTFAWYTSTNAVSAESTALYSATSSSANISIGWSDGAKDTVVSFDASGEGASGIQPMIPTSDLTGSTATSAAFITATATLNEEGKSAFSTASGTGTPWKQRKAGEPETTSLFIMNWNTLAGATVTITPTVTAVVDAENDLIDITGAFRLAAWAGDDYLGTFGPGNTTWAESFAKGDLTTSLENTYTNVASFTFNLDKATTGGATSKQIYFTAWFDGAILGDSWANQSVTFSLAVSAVSLAETGEGD